MRGQGLELIYESETHTLYRVGYMRYFSEDLTIKYTPALLKAGIVHDIALEMAFKKGKLEMIHNPWFELTPKGEDDGTVFDNLDDGLKKLFRVSRSGGLTTAGDAVDEFLDTLSKEE